MRKNKTHLQKRHFLNAMYGVYKASSNSKVANVPHKTHNDKRQINIKSKTLQHNDGLLPFECRNVEVYFEILGFEQSSAMQIVSRYARECNVELKLGDFALLNESFMQQDNIKSSTLQEYGIVASGLKHNVELFFNILESLFLDRLVRGNIASFVIQKLQQNNQSLCIAESCTGGVLSSMITAINGASSVFKGGITTYSIESKQQILGIKDSTIKEHSVYSEECVRAMARGVIDLFQADIAIATSGLASKDVSSSNFLNLPAGLVFTCVLIRDRLPISISHNYLLQVQNINTQDSRIFVQQESSLQALRLLLSVLAS